MYPRYVFGDLGCRSKREYQFDMYIDVQITPGMFVKVKDLHFDQVGSYFFKMIATKPLYTFNTLIYVGKKMQPERDIFAGAKHESLSCFQKNFAVSTRVLSCELVTSGLLRFKAGIKSLRGGS